MLRASRSIDNIDPTHKGVSLFLSYTNMNKIDSLHHVKEHPKISNFLKFERHSSKCFKVKAISDLRFVWKKVPRPHQPRFHVLHLL